MQLPEQDAQGRFLPQFRTASIFARYFAKAIDFTFAGVTIVVLTLILHSYPAAALVGATGFMLTDWLGSPGKWLLQIRAVTLEGAPLGPLASLKRNLVLALPTLSHALLVGGWVGLQGDDRKWDAGIVLCDQNGFRARARSGWVAGGGRGQRRHRPTDHGQIDLEGRALAWL